MTAELLPARWFEKHFIRMLTSLGEPLDKEIESVVAELISATIMQHSCLDLSGRSDAFRDKLGRQSFVGGAGDHQPFVLEDGRLYLNRFYNFEKEVAAMVMARNQPVPFPGELRQRLDELFSDEGQTLAALLAVTRKLAVITGGPGTGKTSTVVRILAILLDLRPDLAVRLAAPTGKAAMRLAESIRSSVTEIKSEHALLNEPEVVTLHRLLGMRHDGRSFRHGAENPVIADLLIVDEASMIDLGLMHRLLQALPMDTCLILLGDPNQLPSVDTGNVLADLCTRDPVFTHDFVDSVSGLVDHLEAVETSYGLANAVAHLTRSFRFDSDSGIGRLAEFVRDGTAPFSDSDDGTVTTTAPITEADCGNILITIWDEYLQLLVDGCTDPIRLARSFDRARVLCSHRKGFPGVEAINQAIEKELERRALKAPDQAFYTGRPVLITVNDYRLDLFNGDIGICFPGEPGEQLIAFPGTTGRVLLASRLPAHETCFAMTVHKAQGSEFEHVSLVLADAEGDDQLVSRELVYTAVTRARSSIALHSSAQFWSRALAASSTRVSGMASFLGDDTQPPPETQLDLFT